MGQEVQWLFKPLLCMICHSHSLHASLLLPLVGLKNPNLCPPCRSLLIEHTALKFYKSFLFFIFNWSVKIHLWVSFWSKFRRPVLYWLEPLIPNSDWRLNSLDSIFLKFNVKVMRLKEMITKLRSSWWSNKLSLLAPWEMWRE